MSKWIVIAQEAVNHPFDEHFDLSNSKHTEYYTDIFVDRNNPPKGYIIASGAELDMKTIYGRIIMSLKSYCEETDKKIYVFSPAWPFTEWEKPDHVEHISCHSYDITNYHSGLSTYKSDDPLYNFDDIGDTWSPDLLFTSYNNRPCVYRTYLIGELAKHNLLDQGIVTYPYLKYPDLTNYLSKYIPDSKELKDPLEDSFKLGTKDEFQPNALAPSYSRGVIDIVTESRINPGEWYLSEKTNKAIITLKPFLVLGSQGYHQWLHEERGIELYHELFDYSFDKKHDLKDRADGIVANIKRLANYTKTPEQCKQLWHKVRDKAERNFFNHMDNMRTGKMQQPLIDFLQAHSDDSFDYTYDCLSKLITTLSPSKKQNSIGEMHQTFDFFRGTVVPYNNAESYNGITLYKDYSDYRSDPTSEAKNIWITKSE
jgi:hypothetical protein